MEFSLECKLININLDVYKKKGGSGIEQIIAVCIVLISVIYITFYGRFVRFTLCLRCTCTGLNYEDCSVKRYITYYLIRLNLLVSFY